MNSPASLGLDELRGSLIAALSTLAANRDYLNRLDQGLGDGDHGSTISRGAEAAIAALEGGAFGTANALFEAVGFAMMTTMGGASGVLFGSWFRAAKHCPPATALDAATLSGFLERGLRDLRRKSQAAVGDKTMMDALIPATEALARGADNALPLAELLAAMAEAARRGAEGTVGMLPRFGRATTLGERVRAAQDPGATSVALFLGSFATAAQGTSLSRIQGRTEAAEAPQ